MKFTFNERRKHRVIGVVVVLSLAALFIPAMMKNTNDQMEEHVHLSIRLPDKPPRPIVSQPDANTMFKTVEVAHVDVEQPIANIKLAQNIKAEPIRLSHSSSPNKPNKRNIAATSKHIVNMANSKLDTNSSIRTYAVQLASFSVKHNAETLVNRLRHKGYKADVILSKNDQGPLYKVVVGQLNKKEQAIYLQEQLGKTMKLKGFVIESGVS